LAYQAKTRILARGSADRPPTRPFHAPPRIREAGGKSAETMEEICNSKATLEAQLNTQRSLLDALRADLGAAREHQAMAESLAASRGTQLEELKVGCGFDWVWFGLV